MIPTYSDRKNDHWNTFRANHRTGLLDSQRFSPSGNVSKAANRRARRTWKIPENMSHVNTNTSDLALADLSFEGPFVGGPRGTQSSAETASRRSNVLFI